jgi:hypothetical protein
VNRAHFVRADAGAIALCFWSCSESITNGIDPNDHTQEPDVRESVRWCSLDSVRAVSESSISDDLARRRWDDLDDLDAAIDRALSEVERPAVRSTLPDEASYRCIVDYIGAYAYWDLPSGAVDDHSRDLEAVEDLVEDGDESPVIERENDPPIADVW